MIKIAVVINATYDGGRHEYSIPFPYLEKAFVKCKLNDKELDINVDYDVDGSTLTLYRDTQTTDTIEIYRQTTTDRLVKFHDGSVLREADLTMLQLQLLHVIEEKGSFTITELQQDVRQLQVERTVNLADGVSCTRGTLLGYKAGGFVKATMSDYTTLMNVVIALGDSHNGKVKVLEQGQYAMQDEADGKTVYVGEDGVYRTTPPNIAGSYVKVIGYIEGDVMQFHPDSLAIQLA